jgi:hypothetical protein
MGRRTVVAAVLACSLWTAVAASAAEKPWFTVARAANTQCFAYDTKLFALPHIKDLGKLKRASDFTPKVLKDWAAPYFAGELKLQQDLLASWGKDGTPKEAARKRDWARFMELWKTIQIPATQRYADASKAGDADAFKAAGEWFERHSAEGHKLSERLAMGVCEWQDG